MSKKLIKAKNPEGRPSKYSPDLLPLLQEHFRQGYSYETFAAIAGVCVDTLYEWEKVHPEFSEAKRTYKALSQFKWEQIGMDGIRGKIHGFSSAGWIFSMKNRFSWHDNVKIETKIDPEDKSKDDQIKKLSEQLSTLKELANGFEQV